MSELLCWNCGENLDDIPRPISRHATCPACFNELHCCRLCKHYDPQKTTVCFEDRADPPLQKENANFCDYFRPRFGAYEAATTTKSDAAKQSLNALFGGDDDAQDELAEDEPGKEQQPNEAAETNPDKNDEARRKLDDLFN